MAAARRSCVQPVMAGRAEESGPRRDASVAPGVDGVNAVFDRASRQRELDLVLPERLRLIEDRGDPPPIDSLRDVELVVGLVGGKMIASDAEDVVEVSDELLRRFEGVVGAA